MKRTGLTTTKPHKTSPTKGDELQGEVAVLKKFKRLMEKYQGRLRFSGLAGKP